MVGIISVLLFLQPFETFILISLFSIVTLIYLKINKSKVKNIGDIRILNDGLRIKNIQYGINLIREIKLYKKINYFLKSFSIANSKSYEALKKIKNNSSNSKIIFRAIIDCFCCHFDNFIEL